MSVSVERNLDTRMAHLIPNICGGFAVRNKLGRKEVAQIVKPSALVSLRSLRRLSNFPNEELESSRELGRDAEQLTDEASLRHDIFFRDPSHSSLPNHVHRFDPLQRAPGRVKGTVAFGQPRRFFTVR